MIIWGAFICCLIGHTTSMKLFACFPCMGKEAVENDDAVTSQSKTTKKMTDAAMRKILDRGYKIFCRMHTDGHVSVRQVKEALWARYPACGIAANALSVTRTHYVIQLSVVLSDLTHPRDLAAFLEDVFRNSILPEQELSDDTMKSVIACVINGRDMWEYYLYQLFMSAGIDRTIIAEVTYGPDVSERLLETVSPPTGSALAIIARNVDMLNVWQPSTMIENSTVVPRELLFTDKTRAIQRGSLSSQPSDHSSDLDHIITKPTVETPRNPTPTVSPIPLNAGIKRDPSRAKRTEKEIYAAVD